MVMFVYDMWRLACKMEQYLWWDGKIAIAREMRNDMFKFQHTALHITKVQLYQVSQLSMTTLTEDVPSKHERSTAWHPNLPPMGISPISPPRKVPHEISTSRTSVVFLPNSPRHFSHHKLPR